MVWRLIFNMFISNTKYWQADLVYFGVECFCVATNYSKFLNEFVHYERRADNRIISFWWALSRLSLLTFSHIKVEAVNLKKQSTNKSIPRVEIVQTTHFWPRLDRTRIGRKSSHYPDLRFLPTGITQIATRLSLTQKTNKGYFFGLKIFILSSLLGVVILGNNCPVKRSLTLRNTRLGRVL